MHSFNHSTQEAKAGRWRISEFKGQLSLQSKF